ncbi:dockerin type I repeat-containing protein, partial [uncultured Ruminococcus sp.]|uniref:dockerin type I repeat-containing protein n=1 Tax=uncultured Ruminococcus sp. TaxID=165186 RepID=UPI0025953EF0
SHSFNQFICTDGKSVYRVDHGDANPRAVAITKCDVDGKITDVRYNYAYSILGGIGDNATGVSVGGFALSKQNCIIAGNSVDMTDENNYSASGQRNVFVTILSKDLDVKSTIFLTKHTEKDGISVRTPQLVALNEEQFLVMWEEVDSEHNITVKAVTINSEGTATSKVETLNYRLSDCQPIFNTSNQCVQWYASNNTALTFYTLDPYGLSENNTLETLYGDVNLDGQIDITDCVLLNKCLTGAVKLNKTAKRNADVDQNNEIDTSDTIYLLQFLIRVIDTLPVSK